MSLTTQPFMKSRGAPLNNLTGGAEEPHHTTFKGKPRSPTKQPFKGSQGAPPHNLPGGAKEPHHTAFRVEQRSHTTQPFRGSQAAPPRNLPGGSKEPHKKTSRWAKEPPTQHSRGAKEPNHTGLEAQPNNFLVEPNHKTFQGTQSAIQIVSQNRGCPTWDSS